MNHLFINLFEFGEEVYCADIVVREGEEWVQFDNGNYAVDVSFHPELPPDLVDPVREFLSDWLKEIVRCHVGLRERAM